MKWWCRSLWRLAGALTEAVLGAPAKVVAVEAIAAGEHVAFDADGAVSAETPDEWVICYRCEGCFPSLASLVIGSAYGPVCHACLDEMSPDEVQVLLAMTCLALELEQR